MAKVFRISRLANGGGKFCPSHYFAQSRVRRRANLLSYSALSPLLLIFLFASALLTGCADKDPVDPAPPLMTRADSIAAGLIAAVPTADGDWGGTTAYDLNGNPIENIVIGGTDSDISEGDTVWGE